MPKKKRNTVNVVFSNRQIIYLQLRRRWKSKHNIGETGTNNGYESEKPNDILDCNQNKGALDKNVIV